MNVKATLKPQLIVDLSPDLAPAKDPLAEESLACREGGSIHSQVAIYISNCFIWKKISNCRKTAEMKTIQRIPLYPRLI